MHPDSRHSSPRTRPTILLAIKGDANEEAVRFMYQPLHECTTHEALAESVIRCRCASGPCSVVCTLHSAAGSLKMRDEHIDL
jgi:hypothetical protein